MRSMFRQASRIRSLTRPLACLAIGSLALCGFAARAAEVTGAIHVYQPGPRISRYLYGHFLEHLGRAVYDGVWVGPDSPIPNRGGLRTDVLDALKALEIPVIRWPGGCYADEYHWRTGIGSPDQRPVTINMSWGGVEETNAFGTHEFFALLEAVGADAYIAGNLGTGSAQEMVEWLEYMTSPSRSTLAGQAVEHVDVGICIEQRQRTLRTVHTRSLLCTNPTVSVAHCAAVLQGNCVQHRRFWPP